MQASKNITHFISQSNELNQNYIIDLFNHIANLLRASFHIYPLSNINSFLLFTKNSFSIFIFA